MSKLREAAQQVVNEHEAGFMGLSLDKAVAALRAALAEPQDEPVAWMYEHDGMVHDAANPPFFAMNRWKTPVGEPYTETPLYTHPAPRRQPLTDEEILAMVKTAPALHTAEAEWLHVARAIERAHGIGGQDE